MSLAKDFSERLTNELAKYEDGAVRESVASFYRAMSAIVVENSWLLRTALKIGYIAVPCIDACLWFWRTLNSNLYLRRLAEPHLCALETYNASEGFFGIQDTLKGTGDMLLMMDYGIYYEFMPMSEYGKSEPKTLLLEEVEKEVNYALVISTNAGLWRYIVGDTIMFTDLDPYRFRITGRTKLFINAFGEELMIDNAEKALAKACRETEKQRSKEADEEIWNIRGTC